jgi:hypothetical protein
MKFKVMKSVLLNIMKNDDKNNPQPSFVPNMPTGKLLENAISYPNE